MGNANCDGSEVSAPAGEGDDGVYVPPERAQPVDGRGPLPAVKSFNRRTVAAGAAIVAVVVLAAVGTVLHRKPAVHQASAAPGTSVAAAPTTPAAINSMPDNYGELAKEHAEKTSLEVPPALGQPQDGDFGGAALASSVRSAAGVSPYQQEIARELADEQQLAARATTSGFGFSGGSAGGELAAAAQAVVDPISGGDGAGRGGARLARDDDNRQDDKTAFLTADHKNRWALAEGIQTPSSPYTILAGAVLPGVMITGINSDLPGQIEGQLSENVYDSTTGRYLLLPQGTKLLGTYDSRITYGQSRVLVVWTRVIRPDGSNIDLEGMPGVDLSGYAGETGKVDRHVMRLLTAVLLGSIIQAGTESSTPGFYQTPADLARQGFAQGVNEATQELVRRELNIQPTIIVAPGARFNVFTTKDIVLPPYQD